MNISEKAARARDASVEDLRALIAGGHSSSVALSYDMTVRVVRLTRMTEAFAQSGLGFEYYMMDLPELLRSTGILSE